MKITKRQSKLLEKNYSKELQEVQKEMAQEVKSQLDKYIPEELRDTYAVQVKNIGGHDDNQ